MQCIVINSQTHETHSEEAIPVCGEDFCDTCGDCLKCYEDSPCCSKDSKHSWIVYTDDQLT